MIRCQGTVVAACYSWMREQGIAIVALPITTGAVSSPMGLGSDSLPVRAVIDGKPTYLADSMQFYLELAVRVTGNASGYVMNTFRGEEVDETHLNEFSHFEIEVPGDRAVAKAAAEGALAHVAAALLEARSSDILAACGRLDHVEALANGQGFRTLGYIEAIDLLRGEDGTLACDGDVKRITRIGERRLIERLGQFTWLEDIPANLTPFYQRRVGNNSTATADLLAGPGEILGLGEREATRLGVEQNLKATGVPEEDYHWYMDMRTVAAVVTSGFGLGIERLMMTLLHVDDIRDCTLVPRNIPTFPV